MNKPITLLLCDTYKTTHFRQYPQNIKKLVSYWTPRKSMLKEQQEMVFFGLQAFIHEYLLKEFKHNFFDLNWKEVEREYVHYMSTQLGDSSNYNIEPIKELHELGFLPLEIRALPEGTKVPMGVPCIELTNTHENFAWLVQWLECLLQVELWPMCNYATIGHLYKQVANEYYGKTVDEKGPQPSMAMSDFGMRGMSCLEDSIRTSAAWLLSFNKTSTIPALHYIQNHYNALNTIGIGAVSTEHSVMGANYAIDGNEITFVKKLLTELYPNTSFSMVSDTYDYWNMVKNILPQCKKEILEHNGKLLIRPDSGDIIEISTGKHIEIFDQDDFLKQPYRYLNDYILSNNHIKELNLIIKHKNKYYKATGDTKIGYSINENFRYLNNFQLKEYELTPEDKGTIWTLWDIFGGTINSKGYKVLNEHIGLIYGDGCTLDRVKEIYTRLEKQGFAASNIVFGVGAFCFHAFFENGKIIVSTRDTFGIAMKATYGEFGNKKLFIYKDPKTDTDNLKKSHKGYCAVYKDKNNKLHCEDQFTEQQKCEFKLVFKNGDFYTENFEEIRRRLDEC